MKRISLDAYIIEVLMADLVGHDRKPSAFIVYLHLWAASRGRRKRTVAASHQQIADETGLSKSAVQSSVGNLLRRKLLRSTRASDTAVAEYTVLRPWIR